MRAIVVALLTLIAANVLAATAIYDVRYDGGSTIHVIAKLPESDGRLLIAKSGGIDQLPNEWATFVNNIHIAGVTIVPAGKEGWTIDATRPVEVSYDVDLEYAKGQWPAGNEQSGRLFNDALYTVTKPLFVYTTTTTDAQVHFALRNGWKVATPWDPAGATAFRVDSVEHLINNSIVIGRFPTAHVRVGAFDIVVATPGLAAVPPRLSRALQQAGALTATLFDRTPRGRYLMTFFHEEAEDGESYTTSAAITSPSPIDRAGMIVTGNTLIHELLHHWIGGQIAPAEHDAMAWFTEGFTEYYANAAIARSGVVPAELMLRKLNNQVAGYLYFFESPNFSGVPLARAGQKKSSYRFGVYNGGWMVALALDVELRTQSQGRHSLDDAMRLLYERNGLAKKPLTVDDVQKAVDDVSGRDNAKFFDTYVLERNELPAAEIFTKLGLDLRGQPYAADVFLIETKPSALRNAMFGF